MPGKKIPEWLQDQRQKIGTYLLAGESPGPTNCFVEGQFSTFLILGKKLLWFPFSLQENLPGLPPASTEVGYIVNACCFTSLALNWQTEQWPNRSLRQRKSAKGFLILALPAQQMKDTLMCFWSSGGSKGSGLKLQPFCGRFLFGWLITLPAASCFSPFALCLLNSALK